MTELRASPESMVNSLTAEMQLQDGTLFFLFHCKMQELLLRGAGIDCTPPWPVHPHVYISLLRGLFCASCGQSLAGHQVQM